MDDKYNESFLESKKVLILLQVFNEIANIEQCINSIKSQTESFICLISDNHSNDGTKELLEDFILKNNENFVLISPPEHLHIGKHFPFIYNFARENFENLPYRIILGGDDYFESSNFLEELICNIKMNSSAEISVPIYDLHDETHSITTKLRIKVRSKKSIIRLLQLAFYPTRLGNYNIVISLMTRDAFNLWAETLIEYSGKQLLSSRPKQSEILATFKLLQNFKVLPHKNTVYVKRIHNPNRSDRVRLLSSNRNQRGANSIQVIRKHWNSSVSIFGMIKAFYKEFNLRDLFLYVFFGHCCIRISVVRFLLYST
jgi:glycosyltransferase involved in cell wall biosynthesis